VGRVVLLAMWSQMVERVVISRWWPWVVMRLRGGRKWGEVPLNAAGSVGRCRGSGSPSSRVHVAWWAGGSSRPGCSGPCVSGARPRA
jgi:hypothetical protein